MANITRMRKWYWKNVKKEFPYKATTKKDAERKRNGYKKAIQYANEALKQYRKAIKTLELQ